ncbi:MAG: hypothetical protein QM308_02395 [Bacillota bacterium]|nr:hypothetical protein [Bacillota bacterium]
MVFDPNDMNDFIPTTPTSPNLPSDPNNPTSSGALRPVKGIDKTRESVLALMHIFNERDLLLRGRTIAQRKEIAVFVMDNEKGGTLNETEKFNRWVRIYLNYVTSWVKQVNLWQIKEMDADTAYFLVQMGVRFIEDLQKVDVEKAYPILIKQGLVQPEYNVIEKDALQKLIINAGAIAEDHFTKYSNTLFKEIKGYLQQIAPEINEPAMRDLKDRLNTSIFERSLLSKA